jgi:regulator of sirC expression with transglutaminase-like and TPR domain
VSESNVVGLFQDLVSREPASINVPAAALAIARIAYPHLPVDEHLAELAAMGEGALQRVRGASSDEARLARLNHYVFAELGFRGNRSEYYDPRNSFLNDVLERRLGIPITLSLVYIELASAAHVCIDGVGFPGHFLVRDVATGWLLDAFNGGRRLEIADCRDLFLGQGHEAREWTEQLLAPVTKRQFLMRMLNNLRRHYSQAGDRARGGMLEAMSSALADSGAEGPAPLLH